MAIKYHVLSRKAKNGQIIHEYNKNIPEYQIRVIKEKHEELMDLDSEISKLETKVMKNYEKDFWSRIISMLPDW